MIHNNRNIIRFQNKLYLVENRLPYLNEKFFIGNSPNKLLTCTKVYTYLRNSNLYYGYYLVKSDYGVENKVDVIRNYDEYYTIILSL